MSAIFSRPQCVNYWSELWMNNLGRYLVAAAWYGRPHISYISVGFWGSVLSQMETRWRWLLFCISKMSFSNMFSLNFEQFFWLKFVTKGWQIAGALDARLVSVYVKPLTHWGRDKMAAIFLTTFSDAFSWMKMFKFRLRCHWSLFPRVQLTISQWVKQWCAIHQCISLNDLIHWGLVIYVFINELGPHWHYGNVIMSVMVSQIPGISIVYSTICSGIDQRKHQSSMSLVMVISPHKGPVTQKMFPFDDIIMFTQIFAWHLLGAEPLTEPIVTSCQFDPQEQI